MKKWIFGIIGSGRLSDIEDQFYGRTIVSKMDAVSQRLHNEDAPSTLFFNIFLTARVGNIFGFESPAFILHTDQKLTSSC